MMGVCILDLIVRVPLRRDGAEKKIAGSLGFVLFSKKKVCFSMSL